MDITIEAIFDITVIVIAIGIFFGGIGYIVIRPKESVLCPSCGADATILRRQDTGQRTILHCACSKQCGALWHTPEPNWRDFLRDE